MHSATPGISMEQSIGCPDIYHVHFNLNGLAWSTHQPSDNSTVACIDVGCIPAVKVNEPLEDFYITMKKTDGSDFVPTSFCTIQQGLDQILNNTGGCLLHHQQHLQFFHEKAEE
ncbi:hypothetical protein HGM15179_008199 [Zosterops borbonicus]|uniref:Uncharacterized protein n=1 Tax=Zosterops borbonicus TaxID=364589 RepID=A0A8K1LLR8_9PASS|nr:hypothetical protein HGM15179_008199 [Zosterops borbonicus]